jgi:hypothetical protein
LARSATCKKGVHKMTAANTYRHPEKGLECRECKRDYMKLYMRARRAAMAVKSRVLKAVKSTAKKSKAAAKKSRPAAKKRVATKAKRRTAKRKRA